jgi:hypothetical protein
MPNPRVGFSVASKHGNFWQLDELFELEAIRACTALKRVA